MIFSLAQQFLLSHCALPHQSAHTGGATNECSRGLTMQKQMEDEIFLFCHFLKKKTLCFIVYIVTLLLEFVPYCPMYLFHHVQCIGDLYLQTLCCWILPRKNAWLLGKKSLCLCAYGLVFQPIFWFSFRFHLLPHKLYHLSNEAIPVLSCFCFCFHFVSFRFVQLIAPLKPNKRKRTCLFCVVMVMVMQVINVLFKWTSEPVKAFEGKITYIALTS